MEKKLTKELQKYEQQVINNNTYNLLTTGMIGFFEDSDPIVNQLNRKDKHITYRIHEKQYADIELWNKTLPSSNSVNVDWALLVIIKPKTNQIKCFLSTVGIFMSGFTFEIDYSVSTEYLYPYIKYLNKEAKLFSFLEEYLKYDNHVVSVKKLLCPYKEDVVIKIQKSLLANCAENYKIACEKLLFMRARALTEYARWQGHKDDERKSITIGSLHGKINLIKDHATDIKNHMYNGFQGCMDSYLDEFFRGAEYKGDYHRESILDNPTLKEYTIYYLEQNFYRQLNERIRIKPDTNLYEIHMGKNWSQGRKNIRSLYITPRYRDGKWENDQSEIRRTFFNYYTIGHLLQAGLVLHNEFGSVLKKCNSFDEYTSILYPKNELEQDELKFVFYYLQYVEKQSAYLNDIPLMFPQFRYDGLSECHKYRADFLILNYLDRTNPKKVIIELSRNSVHDKQGEQDAIRRNDFLEKYKCSLIELRDCEMNNMEEAFEKRIVKGGYLLP